METLKQEEADGRLGAHVVAAFEDPKSLAVISEEAVAEARAQVAQFPADQRATVLANFEREVAAFVARANVVAELWLPYEEKYQTASEDERAAMIIEYVQANRVTLETYYAALNDEANALLTRAIEASR